MLAHFIHHKGKGPWVVALPMLIAFVLFVFFDTFNINDQYTGAISLMLSSVILFKVDTKREIISDGIIQKTGKMVKGKHSFMWIDVKYWSVLLGLWGLILLFKNIR